MSEYDFFLNPETPNTPPRSFRPPGGQTSIMSRLMIVLGGLLFIGILLWIVFGFLLKPDTGPIDRLAAVSTTQADLIEIAQNSSSQLRSSESRELAAGARALLTTDKRASEQLLADAGRKITENEATNSIDQTIRAELETAASANRYDAAFLELYTAKLQAYRLQLAEAYTQTDNEAQKEVYNQAYANVSILLGLDIIQTE